MEKLKWYFKQLLPLKYRSVYHESGVRKITKFRMFFGRCFNIRTQVVE